MRILKENLAIEQLCEGQAVFPSEPTQGGVVACAYQPPLKGSTGMQVELRSDTALTLRGVAGIALGALEIGKPEMVMQVDHLDAGAEPLVQIAGLHKAVIGAGLLTAVDERPWLAAALAGSVYDGIALVRKRASASAYGRLAVVVLVDVLLLARAMRSSGKHAS